MSKAPKAKRESVPKNFPYPTEEDLKESPSRLINIGRAQDFIFPNNFVKTSKYELYNFLPKFLLEEFNPKTKIANCYFLILAILQTIPQITNTDGYPTVLLPLTFVVLVDGIFAAIEDVSRHRADKEANNASTERYHIHEKATGSMKWADLAVGDFVKIYSREKVPADMVVLAVAEKAQPAQGLCYVETKSLDGETNLKTRLALPGTMARVSAIEDVSLLSGVLEAEHPNKSINSFSGVVTLQGMPPEPIGPQNVLLRGCVLRNTDWVVGCVLNTGHHTKILMSAAVTPNKLSGLEAVATAQVKKMILFLSAVSAVGACGSLGWNVDNGVDAIWYLDWGDINFGLYFLIQFFYFFLIHATFIPVSLYVSMTLARFFQSYFMTSDLSMYYAPLDAPALVRTMTLNEELGQISHIFSDKTGTLTRNVMDFRKASICGTSYGLGITEIGKASWKLQGIPIPEEILLAQAEAQRRSVPHVTFFDPQYDELMGKSAPADGTAGASRGSSSSSSSSTSRQKKEQINTFFRILALCHDTIPERIDGKIRLSASNPDDEALVCAATYFGFEFKDKLEKYAILQNASTGAEERVEILDTIGFTSRRKRMSVIVRDPDGQIRLVSKGADSAMATRLAGGQEQLFAITDEHMRQYALEGMRCLLVAQRDISEAEYASWHGDYLAALTSLAEVERRKAEQPNAIDALEDALERGLTLVGATAIEDRLQAGVPECVAQLSAAGISIWVLTGDKEETAINIAVASNLVLPTQHMKHVIVNKTICPSLDDIKLLLQREVELFTAAAAGDSKPLPRALIIDGNSVMDIMAEAGGAAREQLLTFSTLCRAVVGCRVSPDQKREMVALVKHGVPGVRTLAVGDGANDVAMIQAADVGVGIRGEEGVQAVNASDYAIGQFEYLKVLLLKHGRYNYSRMCRLIIYMFYKNILMSIVTFWWSWLNGFSGQKVYTEVSIQFFNLMFTSLPILLLGIYDMDVEADVVYKYPALYAAGIRNEHFNTKVFWTSNINAVFDSIILTYIPIFQLENFSETGVSETFFQAGALTYTAVIFVANIRVALMQYQWHSLNALILFLSVGSWFLVGWAVSSLVAVDYNWYQLFDRLLGEESFWLSLFCVVTMVFMKDIALLHVANQYWPSETQILTEAQCYKGAGRGDVYVCSDSAELGRSPEVCTEMIDTDKPGSSMRFKYGAKGGASSKVSDGL
jgi:phospholipid-transporting ATPase